MKKFTLIELLIVIAIIGILLTLLLPSLKKSREIALKAVCLSNCKQTHNAALLYAKDNKQWVPSSLGFNDKRYSKAWRAALRSYISSDKKVPDLFKCSKHNELDESHLEYSKKYPSLGMTYTWRINNSGLNGHYSLNGISNHNNPSTTRMNNNLSDWLMFGDSNDFRRISIKSGGSEQSPKNYRHLGLWNVVTFNGSGKSIRWLSIYNAITFDDSFKGDFGNNSQGIFLNPEADN